MFFCLFFLVISLLICAYLDYILTWPSIEKVEYKGDTGKAIWQTIQIGGLRVPIIEYKEGCLADSWREKDRVVHGLKGSFITELKTGEK